MREGSPGVWLPQQADIDNAAVTGLMRRLGFDDYEAFYHFSVEQPAAYWREVVDFCGIKWQRDYSAYVDVSRSQAFPQWFVGGQLNWVDTVLGWADAPAQAGQAAVIGEREDGAAASITYAELKSRVQHFSAGLLARGVRQGDRIGLLMENGIEATVSFLSLSYIGAIAVPLFSGFGADAIVSRLSACGARMVIATSGFSRRGRRVQTRALVDEVLQKVPHIECVIWKRGRDEAPADGFTDWDDVLVEAEPLRASAVMSPMDPFMVVYTSGTTGKPKGPVHTHGGFPLKVAHDSAVHFDIRPGDVLCFPADMGWIAGALMMASALLRGATLICYDGAPDFPDWSRMSRLVERYKVTHFGSAPTLIRGMSAHPDVALAGDRSTVRVLITAGEGIDPEHFIWYQQHFGRGVCPVINYTGGTEVSGALLSSVVVKPILPGAFNTSSPGVEADVVDAGGLAVEGQIGELAIRKPFVGMTASFWQDDARYLESYWQTVPGMWIHGDLAMRTGGNTFQLLGRSDDTLKVAGKRLGPAEVEEVLLELKAVAEAAAIGVNDVVKGQKLVVFVIPSREWDGDRQALATAVARQVDERLGKPFRPSHVHIVRLLPKTRSSKIMRRLIRAAYTGQPLGDISSLDDPASLDEIRTAIPA
ncbi:MAG: acetate--CoA ligase [Comamonadaceae bacterium]|nr:MAG: acetate--CoA ligase [Comamonadaceae bacterium]